MLHSFKSSEENKSSNVSWLISLYRFPFAFGLSLVFGLVLPIELIVRFLLIVPYYAFVTPRHVRLQRIKKHARLRVVKIIRRLAWWVKNEDGFPWHELGL